MRQWPDASGFIPVEVVGACVFEGVYITRERKAVQHSRVRLKAILSVVTWRLVNFLADFPRVALPLGGGYEKRQTLPKSPTTTKHTDSDGSLLEGATAADAFRFIAEFMATTYNSQRKH